MKYIKSPKKAGYTILSISTFLIFLLLQATLEPTYGQWTKHIIELDAPYIGFVDTYDIDSDGDVDIFATQEYDGKVLLYLNNNNVSWEEHILDAEGGGPVGVNLADIDGDGNMDFIVGFFDSDLVAWYKNEGGNPIQWIKDTIDNSRDGGIIGMPADINGDGYTDIISRWFFSGEIIWYENNLPDDWISHLIATDIINYGIFDIGDIDNDNQPDIVKSTADQGEVVTFKNNLPNENWSEIVVDGNMPGTRCPIFADFDNDGDLDIATSAPDALDDEADVAWYENDSSGNTWTKHDITSKLSKVLWIDTDDMNNDGDMDIVVSDNNENMIIVFFNEGRGRNWSKYMVEDNYEKPYKVFIHDMDMDGDPDIIHSGYNTDYSDSFVWYENPFGSAYAVSLDASPALIQARNDTLVITTGLFNPENHPLSAYAVIRGDQSGFTDTLQLFDDGLHNDSLSSDNIWGNTRLTTGLPEDGFKVDIITYDSTTNESFGFLTPARFFTLGPVEYKGYSSAPHFIFCNKENPEPGGCFRFELKLRNNSSAATATNISAELISLDTIISITESKSDFPEILAGDSSISNNSYMISIPEDWSGDKNIPIQVNISSYGTFCWRDTFIITVVDPTISVEGIKSPTIRIYPNPVNDLLSIQTSKIGQYFLVISTLSGQLIYDTIMEGTSHQIDLSSFKKGVYIITIRSKDFVTTRKIIKL